MDKKIIHILEQGIEENFSKGIPFPEYVKKMMDLDVERYCTDLIALQNTYYAADGSSYTAKLPLPHFPGKGDEFCQVDVVDALRTIQQGAITYPEFLNRIIKAGVVSYSVYILGKQVHYMGAKGEIHIEHFPQ